MSTGTGKALSNGTLSLRFMQNAQRAKQQTAVDIERAKVKDEAEWEVSREIREAWGLASSSKLDSEQTIIQETSYLPFLFPSLRNDGTPSNEAADEVVSSTTKVNGRRTFVKGREILANSSSTDGPSEGGDERYADAGVKQEVDAAKPSALQKEHRKARIVGPLTGKKASAKMAELGRVDLMANRKPYTASDVPVLSMISEETPAAVGTDLRQTRQLKGKMKERETELASEKVSALEEEEKQPVEPGSRDYRTLLNGVSKGPLSFIRPAGVDSPARPISGAITGAKRERERDDDNADEKVSLASRHRKAGREGLSTAAPDAADGQRQVAKKKKKKVKVESGLSIPLL